MIGERDREELGGLLAEAAFPTSAGPLIHTLAPGGIGADWPLDAALALLDDADEFGWGIGFAGHDLEIRAGSLVRYFDVRRPADG